jgi:hypothetical protein
MVISIAAAVVLYVPIFGLLDFVLFGAIWNIGFWLFYNKLFGVK